jgi:hypothetical protein
VSLGDHEGAIDLLEPYFERVEVLFFKHTQVDPDMAPLRENARYRAMCDAARARLGLAGEARAASANPGAGAPA